MVIQVVELLAVQLQVLPDAVTTTLSTPPADPNELLNGATV
jgi:hypothetical protein